MVPKQVEMDGIVKQIYTAIESKPHLASTLLVLLGDHGMNDAGNHGGSAPGETSPALVFLSPKLQVLGKKLEAPVAPRDDYRFFSVVEQSDLVPTLGALLGFPVPNNNLGAFILDFLPFWPQSTKTSLTRLHWVLWLLTGIEHDQAQLLLRNAEQILGIIEATFGSELFSSASSPGPCHAQSTDIEDLACRWQALSQSAKDMETETGIDQEWTTGMSQVR